MISKISAQVGSEKKSYVKEYEAKLKHALKCNTKKQNINGNKNKENSVLNIHGKTSLNDNTPSIDLPTTKLAP